jgi:hypothetical protein
MDGGGKTVILFFFQKLTYREHFEQVDVMMEKSTPEFQFSVRLRRTQPCTRCKVSLSNVGLQFVLVEKIYNAQQPEYIYKKKKTSMFNISEKLSCCVGTFRCGRFD